DAGEGWSGASIGHAVTWSVRDSAALLDATSGPDVGDPYWAPPPARPFLQEVGRDPGRLRVALTVKPWIEGPVDPECADAARAIHTVHRTGRAVARFLETYDVLITPTMAKPPHPLGVLSLSNPDTAAFIAARTASVGFTSLFNSSGHPAMSVPLAMSRSGLP